MATTIVTKNGSGAPTDSDLVAGELAVDLTNGRLYTTDLDSGGTVLELGTNPASDVTFGDNTKAIFGAGSDLQIYHDGTDSIISESGVGSLDIRGTNVEIKNAAGTEYCARFITNDKSSLYYDGSEKLATTATGVDVTGTVTADGLTVDGSPVRFVSTAPMLNFMESGDIDSNHRLRQNAGNFVIQKLSDDEGTATDRLLIDGGTGDISFYEDTGTTAKFFWDASAESLGIGGSTSYFPNTKLTVGNTSNSQDGVNIITSTTGTGWVLFGDGSSTAAYRGILGYQHSSDAMYFSTAATERMRIDSSGNVGIGTSPSAQLHLQNGSTEDVSGSTIRMDLSGVNPYWELQARNGGTSANRQLGFYTSSTSGDVLTLTQAGNVGIGDGNPLSILHIGGGSDANVPVTFAPSTGGNAEFRNTSSTGTFTFTNNNGSSEAMRIDAGGNLLVGTTDATATGDNGWAFFPDGGAYSRRNGTASVIHFRFYNNADVTTTEVGNITSSGSSTAYNTSSDQRLKDNIVDAPSASDDIDAIQVRSFDWKADGSHQKYGMVAQELVTVAPEAVSQPDDPEEMMGVDYSKLVPMMLKEIQSLRARVSELESK
jgi:hypothetical protein